jgi:hypothetical protein
MSEMKLFGETIVIVGCQSVHCWPERIEIIAIQIAICIDITLTPERVITSDGDIELQGLVEVVR